MDTPGPPPTAPAPPWLVVLNWNGRADTLECLDTLRRAVPAPHVVLVDNGSTDGTTEAVAAAHPDVEILQTGSNLGYAGGNNVGVRHALDRGADVIGVLNNDTLVEPGFLDPLLARLAEVPLGVLSPEIRYAADPATAWFRGGIVDRPRGWPRHLTPDEQRARPGDDPLPSEILTGCCLLANAATWRDVGLFDERFFLLFEDSDWSMRAASRGHRLEVVPTSIVQHKVSASFTGSAATLGTFYFLRNGLLFNTVHRGPGLRWVRLRFLEQWLLRPTVRELRARRPGTTGAIVMRVAGVLCFALARFGVAPPTVHRLARLVTRPARGR